MPERSTFTRGISLQTNKYSLTDSFKVDRTGSFRYRKHRKILPPLEKLFSLRLRTLSRLPQIIRFIKSAALFTRRRSTWFIEEGPSPRHRWWKGERRGTKIPSPPFVYPCPPSLQLPRPLYDFIPSTLLINLDKHIPLNELIRLESSGDGSCWSEIFSISCTGSKGGLVPRCCHCRSIGNQLERITNSLARDEKIN